MSREEFVRMLTAELPERPGYFALDAQINREGAEPLAELPPLAGLSPDEVARRQEAGAVVLDTRPTAQYGAGHVPGSIHIGLGGQYASWAGILIGLKREIVLVAEDPERLEESRMRLARVGIEKVAGHLVGGVLAWEKSGRRLAEVPQISVVELAEQLRERPGEIQVVDVRKAGEWEAGHVEQAVLKPLSELTMKIADLDPEKPIAVHCKSGYRSSIATSLLKRAGFREVMNVTGGFDAWVAQKLPVAGQTTKACAN